MKKYFSLFMTILFFITLFSGCANTASGESMGDGSLESTSGRGLPPVLRNVLEAAAFYQQPENKDAELTYGRYVLDLDYASFTSVADVYSNDVQIPFTFVGELAVPGATEGFVEFEILGFNINDFSDWSFYSEPGPDGYIWDGMLDPDKYGIDFSSEYAFVTLNRPVEMLSIYHAIDDDGNELIPYHYAYGTLTDSNPRRPLKENNDLWVSGTPGDYDNLRCIFSNEYHQDILYIYTIPHSAPPFNLAYFNGLAYHEYSQIEIN